MTSFHEVRFPLRLALGASGGPERRTEIVSLSNGREKRNSRWKNSRRRYDAGSGLRSIDDLYKVVAFFEARSGQLYGFRFADPLDFQSCPPGSQPKSSDQKIGVGDGSTRTFQLSKTYADAGGSNVRSIVKPVPDTVMIEVAGVRIADTRFSVDHTSGLVTFAAAAVPADGEVVRAGFAFDVPVRFDTERIEIDLDAFSAGRIPSIPLVEIRP